MSADNAAAQAKSPKAHAHGDTAFVARETPADSPVTPAPDSADKWAGKTLGKYQITGLLGQGGMGVVLQAYDPLIQRSVAIKVLADELARDEIALARFLAEARAAGKLNHANVCAVYEICREGDTCFLVMEHITGGSLENWLESHGPCSVFEATQAMIDACKGVSAAHAAGLIHRDIKPANFIRAADGAIKVTDFGLAKVAGGFGRQLTQTGLVVGTPFFMSPEQCEAKPVDTRTDIYSLGATYYSLLTARYPYANSDSVPQIMYNHCFGPIPDPREIIPNTPPACSRIVSRAMSKLPAERYQSAAEMLVDLQAVLAALSGQTMVLPSDGAAKQIATQPQSLARQRWPIAVAVGGVCAGLIALVLFLWQPWRAAPVPVVAEPIKVGVLHSLHGTMANSESVVIEATLFAIDEINQAGGLLGRPVKAIVADGRSDEKTFAVQAEKLISKDKVCTVFGCWTSASRRTVKPIFEEHDHLLVYPLQYEGIEGSPCIIYMGAAPNQQIIPAVDWAVKTLQKKSFFLVGSDYVFPRAANEIIKDHLKSLDVRVAGEAYVPLGSAAVQEAVNAIVKAKPDMILNTINGDTNTDFFKALRHAGVKPAELPTLSFSVGEQELRSLNLADIQGDYAAWTYFQAVATPENKQFVRRFRDKHPQRSVTDPMESAYVGVKMWANAVNDAQSLEPKAIRRALLNQRFDSPGGAVRIDADTQHCYKTPRIGQIQGDGQFKIVWTAQEPVAPQPYSRTRTAGAWRAFLLDLYRGWGDRWAAPEAN